MTREKKFWYVVQSEGLVVAGPFNSFSEANDAMDWIMDRQVGSFDLENTDKKLDEGDKI